MTLIEALKISSWVTKGSANKNLRFRASFRDMVDQDNFCANFSAVELVCHNDWEPYKELCKHEPIEWTLHAQREIKTIEPKCKHCGVNLKAEKWVEA